MGADSQGFNKIIHSYSNAGGLDGKEPACNAGDPGSIPGSGRFPGEGNHYPLSLPSILAWRIPWTEEPGGLQSMGLQKTWTLNT